MPRTYINSRIQAARYHLDDAAYVLSRYEDYTKAAAHLERAVEQLRDAANRARAAAVANGEKEKVNA